MVIVGGSAQTCPFACVTRDVARHGRRYERTGTTGAAKSRCDPWAVRGTRVYPKALACLALVVTLRSRYCAAYASRPCWPYALPWRHRL